MEKIDRGTAESISYKATSYHHNIVSYLNDHELQNLCYARKSRVKSKKDILGKYNRKKTDPDKKGYKIEDIAEQCGITLSSVRTYFKNIYEKTQCCSQIELMHLLIGCTIQFEHID